MEPGVRKMTKKDAAYFTLYWSRFLKADRSVINGMVPARGGVFEVYVLDQAKTLNLVTRRRAYYGGVRHTLRAITDPGSVNYVGHKHKLEPDRLFFRFVLTDSYADMSDIMFFFSRGHGTAPIEEPEDTPEPSGQYTHIFLKEITPDPLHTLS